MGGGESDSLEIGYNPGGGGGFNRGGGPNLTGYRLLGCWGEIGPLEPLSGRGGEICGETSGRPLTQPTDPNL